MINNDLIKNIHPKTIQEAIDYLLDVLDNREKDQLAKTPKEDLVTYHFSLGVMIRNAFNLWDENSSIVAECSCHPDDVSSMIIERLWNRLQHE